MFKPTLIATLAATFAALGASAAIAQEITPTPEIDNFVPQKTRAQVIAETQDAMRRGLIERNEFDARRVAEKPTGPQKTRAQVRAETAEALRLGLVGSGELGAPQATPEQAEQIRAAGLRALERERQLARR